SLLGRCRTLCKQLKNRRQDGPRIDPVCPADGRLIERTPPLVALKQHGARLKAERPSRGQFGERTASTCGMPEQSVDAILAKTVEQDVGKRRARLPLARCENRRTVREMKRQIGIGD